MDEWWKRESLLKFESPTSIFLVSPSSSGKIVLTKNILKHSDGMFRIPPSKMFYCYSIWQNLYSDMQNEISNIHFHKGLPSMETLTEWGSLTGHKMLVLDDLMTEAADSSEIVHLMCVGSHYHQITVIHILQNVFHQGKSMRSASVNAHYFILMNNKRDKKSNPNLRKANFPRENEVFLGQL